MTIYALRLLGLPARSWPACLVVLFSALAFTGCDVQWGGATVRLEDPSPVPVDAEEAPQAVEEAAVSLPAPPLLWVVRSEDPGGAARAIPVARLQDGLPVPLDYPASAPDGYREAFDSLYAASGLELSLGSGGVRIGSLALSGQPYVIRAECPSAVAARVLVPPGVESPAVAFAWQADSPVIVEREDSPQVDNTIRTFGPILAEQLLREAGEQRPFLARRAALSAVPWQDSPRPGMAATYLVNDSLGSDLPDGPAASLYFVARFEPARGYVPHWSEVRFYDAGSREAFVWLDAWPGPGGRVDVAVRHDGVERRLVASLARTEAERTIDWVEIEGCPSLDMLEVAR